MTWVFAVTRLALRAARAYDAERRRGGVGGRGRLDALDKLAVARIVGRIARDSPAVLRARQRAAADDRFDEATYARTFDRVYRRELARGMRKVMLPVVKANVPRVDGTLRRGFRVQNKGGSVSVRSTFPSVLYANTITFKQPGPLGSTTEEVVAAAWNQTGDGIMADAEATATIEAENAAQL